MKTCLRFILITVASFILTTLVIYFIMESSIFPHRLSDFEIERSCRATRRMIVGAIEMYLLYDGPIDKEKIEKKLIERHEDIPDYLHKYFSESITVHEGCAFYIKEHGKIIECKAHE